MPRTLAITLARGGSKGIKDKNISLCNGHPLLFYTFKEVKEARNISRYIVSTDSDQIRDYSQSQGIDVPFLRPSELASDTATSAAALRHAVIFCEEQEGKKYDYVIELMCTNPFKKAHHIDECIEKLKTTKSDSVIGMSILEEFHPARIKKIIDDKIVDFCVPELSSRRQELRPYAYIRNGSIYAIQRDLLVNKGYRFGGDNSRPYIMDYPANINIDSPQDLLLSEILMKKGF